MARTQPKTKSRPEPKASVAGDLFTRLEGFLEKRSRMLFFILLGVSTLFSLMLFDSKLSLGGDDANYVERAWTYITEGKFPYFQGPGYPLFLSIFLKIFGLNIIVLKIASVALHIVFVFFTYKAFVRRIPYTILFLLMIFIAVNNHLQYYSSQTFTETFFLALQAIALWFTFNLIERIHADDTWRSVIRTHYRTWIGFGILFMVVSISKSIAIVCVAGVAAYFLLRRQVKPAVIAIASFLLFRALFQLVAAAIYGPSESDQFEMILRKDLYKPAMGHEDLSGLITRFFSNFNTYFSLHIYRLMNIRRQEYQLQDIVPGLAFITTVLFAIIGVVSYRRNKYVFLSLVYMFTLSCAIFIGIQANNFQDRLIIIVLPLVLVVFGYGGWELSRRSGLLQTLFVILVGVFLLGNAGKSVVLAQKNIPALKKNLGGDIYYGYTPDWENFLKMSRYCADNLAPDAGVLSRKPGMSMIYAGGKKFRGQFWVTPPMPTAY